MLNIADIKPGDTLIAGDGFSCLKAGLTVEVFRADREYGGELAVTCKHGPHLLAVGAGRDGEITRFSRAPVLVSGPAGKRGR